MLIHLGVIELPPSLQSLFPDAGSPDKLMSLLAEATLEPEIPKGSPPTEGPTLTTDQAYILRAAAVNACELIVEKAHALNEPSWLNDIQLPKLDMWLWSVAKDRPDYRRLERFVLRDSVFF